MAPLPIPEDLNDRPGVPMAGHAPGLPAWEAARASARKTLIVGAIITTIGLAISVGTYVAAASNPNGGHYFLAFGPVIVGVFGVGPWISRLESSRATAGRDHYSNGSADPAGGHSGSWLVPRSQRLFPAAVVGWSRVDPECAQAPSSRIDDSHLKFVRWRSVAAGEQLTTVDNARGKSRQRTYPHTGFMRTDLASGACSADSMTRASVEQGSSAGTYQPRSDGSTGETGGRDRTRARIRRRRTESSSKHMSSGCCTGEIPRRFSGLNETQIATTLPLKSADATILSCIWWTLDPI